MTRSPRAQIPPRRGLIRYLQAARDAGCPRDQALYLCKAGIVLQPRQLAFAAAARECDRDDGPTEVALGGARMGGKSHAVVSVLGDDCTRHQRLKCLLLRKVGASARESFEALLPKTIGRLGAYKATRAMFEFPNASWIRLGHFQSEGDIDKYLGLEYDVIALEEAATLSAAKEQAISSCNRSPAGSGWRARKYLTTNPGGVGHAWFKERFVEPFRSGSETDTRFIPATVDDNAFATAQYRKFLDGLTGWLKAAWRYGDWDISAGQFFTTWRGPDKPGSHVVKPFPVPEGWRVWLGFDYGFTHFTQCYLLTQSGDGVLYVVAEHAERRWLPERHGAAIHAMLARHGVKPARLTGVYAGPDVFSPQAHGGTIADDYRTNKLHPLTFYPAVTDRVNGAAELLRRLGDADAGIGPTLYVFDTCRRLIECIPRLEHDPHRPEDVRKVDCDDEGRGGDDAYDACRYGIMAGVAGGQKVYRWGQRRSD